MDTVSLPPTRSQLSEEGRMLRTAHPREDLAKSSSAARDPLSIIERQNETRIPELVPLRRERMSESPLTFYRGTAALMAADLADAPSSGILVPSCGDAHVSNFGLYASQQRSLVFDLNDFDESAWAPWEWDVKRLVTSVIIGGRATGHKEAVTEKAAREAIRIYLASLRSATERSPVERYFDRLDIESARDAVDASTREVIESALARAQKRTGKRAVRRLTEKGEDGIRRIALQGPTTLPAPEESRRQVQQVFDAYRSIVPADVALLFHQLTPVDIALRVVGVGSVGTRCYLVLLQDGDGNALLMQPKQASASVLVEYGRVPQPQALQDIIATSGEGARVVDMQRILQAVSDPFLGHVRAETADYYVRQFHDMKGGVEVEELDDKPFIVYARACAAVLARAHSQSSAAAKIVGYAGSGDEVTEALMTWCDDYAGVSAGDHAAFVAAVA